MKSLFTVIAVFCIGIVLFQILSVNMLFSFLLLMGLFFFILGDILIGWKVTKNHLLPLLDPTRPDEEVCILFDFGGHVDFVKARKGPFGKREFVRYHKNASVINSGDYKVKFINGNYGFVGHEDYDSNVSLLEAEALSKCEGDTVKEVYRRLPKKGLHGSLFSRGGG